jgi:hypothetical protein
MSPSAIFADSVADLVLLFCCVFVAVLFVAVLLAFSS